MAKEIRCPGCGQSDARKLSMLFEQGTVVNKMNPMVGVGMGSGGGLGIGVASGIGWKGQSALASRLAPPELDTFSANAFGWMVFAIAFAAGFVASLSKSDWGFPVMFFGAPLVGFTTYRLTLRGELPEYESAVARWNRQWCCMRCGEVFDGGNRS